MLLNGKSNDRTRRVQCFPLNCQRIHGDHVRAFNGQRKDGRAGSIPGSLDNKALGTRNHEYYRKSSGRGGKPQKGISHEGTPAGQDSGSGEHTDCGSTPLRCRPGPTWLVVPSILAGRQSVQEVRRTYCQHSTHFNECQSFFFGPLKRTEVRKEGGKHLAGSR